MSIMTISEWLTSNGVHKSVIEKGRAVVAIGVKEDDNPDTITIDKNDGQAVYMKKVADLSMQVDTDKIRVFVIGMDSWKKMTTKNLFLSKLTNKEE